MILQQEDDTIPVSNFQLLLHAQHVKLGLNVEHVTSGVEHTADILADVRDALKFRCCSIERNCSLVFQCVPCVNVQWCVSYHLSQNRNVTTQ